jgi:PAS domain S-box-containing protein
MDQKPSYEQLEARINELEAERKQRELWRQQLRQQAEKLLRPYDESASLPPDIDELINELKTYQAELEIQNEELRTTQQQLLHSRDRLDTLFQLAPIGYALITAEGAVVEANQTLARMLNLDREQLRKKYFSDLICEEDRPVFLGRFKALFKQPENKRMELRLSSNLVTERWVCLEGRQLPNLSETDGKQSPLLLAITDISELHRSERMMRTIIDSAPVGICITNREGTFEHVNPAYCRLYKYSEEELIGKHFTLVVPEPHKQTLRDLHDAFIEGRQELRGEWEVVDKYGQPISIIADAARILYDDNQPRKVTFVMNVTESRELEQLKEDVDRMMRHDLKQPLNAIVGFPGLLLMDDNLTEQQRNYLRRISETGMSMLNMIETSLDMFKMEKGTYVYEPTEVDLLGVLKEVIEHSQSRSTSCEVTSRLLLNGHETRKTDRLVILSDKRLLYRLLSNLYSNAIDASPPGETVFLKINTPAGLNGSAPCRIRIQNSGTVPQEIRNNFFGKYVTAGKQTGTGLGTYSARLLAETMGYGIDMSTSDDTNSTALTLTIPTQHNVH